MSIEASKSIPELCISLGPVLASPVHCPMPTNKLEYPIPRRRTISDPLAAALQPPVDESPVARELRLKAEIDAKKVSDSIDDMIRQERNDRKRSKPEVSVLLLGQSESGKSTTLKRESSRRHFFPALPITCGNILTSSNRVPAPALSLCIPRRAHSMESRHISEPCSLNQAVSTTCVHSLPCSSADHFHF